MKNSKNIPTELLVRYLSGEATAEEKDKIEQWRQHDSENEKVFQEFKSIWDAKYHSLIPAEVMESDWQKIHQRIFIPTAQRGKLALLDAFLKIAAVLLVMLAVSGALYTYWNVPGYGRWASFSTGDYVDSLRLPDNSIVYLNNHSSLKYLRNFGDGKRSVRLDGEGFFDVQHDADNPFRIHTPEGVVVEVLGTSFHLEAGKGLDELELNVTQGVVSFGYRDVLKPVYAGNSAFVKEDNVLVKPIEDNNFLSWKTGKLVFRQSSLPAIAKAIQKHFDEIKEVRLLTQSDVKVSTTFTNQPVNEVLDELELLFDKKFHLKEGVLTISD